jgi:hypothetical protein
MFIILVIWCVLMLVLGSWGLDKLPLSCTKNQLFNDLRILIVSSISMLTFIVCMQLCKSYCENHDDSTATKIIYFSSFVISLLQTIISIRIAVNFSTCVDDKKTYINYLICCTIFTGVIFLSGLLYFYENYARKTTIPFYKKLAEATSK